MRTSLNELQMLEQYLAHQLEPQDNLLIEAKLLVDKRLQDKLYWQRRSYQLVKTYGREQLRQQLNRVEEELFTEPAHKRFVHKIKQYFR